MNGMIKSAIFYGNVYMCNVVLIGIRTCNERIENLHSHARKKGARDERKHRRCPSAKRHHQDISRSQSTESCQFRTQKRRDPRPGGRKRSRKIHADEDFDRRLHKRRRKHRTGFSNRGDRFDIQGPTARDQYHLSGAFPFAAADRRRKHVSRKLENASRRHRRLGRHGARSAGGAFRNGIVHPRQASGARFERRRMPDGRDLPRRDHQQRQSPDHGRADQFFGRPRSAQHVCHHAGSEEKRHLHHLYHPQTGRAV